MAFSALLSCETPTTALRTRMVRIWRRQHVRGVSESCAVIFRGLTYHGRVYKCAPTALVLEEGQAEGHGGRAEQDEDKLVLELLKNKLPQRGWWFFRDGILSVLCPQVEHLIVGQTSAGIDFEAGQDLLYGLRKCTLHGWLLVCAGHVLHERREYVKEYG
jgi:hypothetical protein